MVRRDAWTGGRGGDRAAQRGRTRYRAADRAGCRAGVRSLGRAGEVAHPHRCGSGDQLLDAGCAERDRARPGALVLAMAFGDSLGLGGGGGLLRDLLALLFRQGDAARGRHSCLFDLSNY